MHIMLWCHNSILVSVLFLGLQLKKKKVMWVYFCQTDKGESLIIVCKNTTVSSGSASGEMSGK